MTSPGWGGPAEIQSNLFVVSPQYSVNPPTRSTNSYPALQIFTWYRVSSVTLPDFEGPDGGTISGLDCIVWMLVRGQKPAVGLSLHVPVIIIYSFMLNCPYEFDLSSVGWHKMSSRMAKILISKFTFSFFLSFHFSYIDEFVLLFLLVGKHF